MTNPGNKIADLSQAQVQAIFSGSPRLEPGSGPARSGPIDIVVRTAAPARRTRSRRSSWAARRSARARPRRRRTASWPQAVKSDPNAVGYVSLAFTKGLTTSRYKGVACNLRNAKSGQYEGVRNFWMVTRGKPPGGAAEVHPLDPAQQGGAGDHRHGLGADSGARWPDRVSPASAPNRSDQRAELMLGALASVVLVLIAGMVVFVLTKAWPSFAHNGLAWFGSRRQRRRPADRHLQLAREPGQLRVHAPRLAAALRDGAGDGRRGRARARFALFAAIFIVEFAPGGCGACSSRWCGCSPRCPR